MLGKGKTDPELGFKVEEALKAIRRNTPLVENGLTEFAKKQKIEEHFKAIMETLGLDLTDDSLMDTPKRVSKMYVDEIFYGLNPDNFPKCTTVENKMGYDELVVEKNVNVQSNCEHHFVVIDGKACIAYIPRKKILGLSKINRIVEYFAKRPQIQERLTEQVYYALAVILETDDIAVVIDAVHYCVKSRGIEDTESSTVTSKLGGKFKTNPDLRREFFSIVKS